MLHGRDQRVRLPLELIDTNTGAEQQREPLPDPRPEAGQQPLGRSLGIRGGNHIGNCHTPENARNPRSRQGVKDEDIGRPGTVERKLDRRG